MTEGTEEFAKRIERVVEKTFEALLKLEGGQLEDFDGLDDLRREPHPHFELLVEG